MHRIAAGTATATALPNQEAEETFMSEYIQDAIRRNPHISHQTGAELLLLEFQMIELMKYIRQAAPFQAIRRHVPILQAITMSS
jgi:hypothetical protein